MLALFLCGSGASENSMAPKPLATRGHSCLLPLLVSAHTFSVCLACRFLRPAPLSHLALLPAFCPSVPTPALRPHSSAAASCHAVLCPGSAHAPLLSGIKHALNSCFSLLDGSCPLMSPSPPILISPLSPAPLPLTSHQAAAGGLRIIRT